jgi:hypothetical protein
VPPKVGGGPRVGCGADTGITFSSTPPSPVDGDIVVMGLMAPQREVYTSLSHWSTVTSSGVLLSSPVHSQSTQDTSDPIERSCRARLLR